jgi:hypothetical protein
LTVGIRSDDAPANYRQPRSLPTTTESDRPWLVPVIVTAAIINIYFAGLVLGWTTGVTAVTLLIIGLVAMVTLRP